MKQNKYNYWKTIKWAPTVFLAGALTYAIISGFREGWNKASEKPNLETKVVQEHRINNMDYVNPIIKDSNMVSYSNYKENYLEVK